MSGYKGYIYSPIPEMILQDAIEQMRKKMPKIEQIIINPPATIIIWKGGTKTVCKSNEEFDPEVGVAMCIAKKYFGSRNQFTKAAGKASNEYLERLAKGQKGK